MQNQYTFIINRKVNGKWFYEFVNNQKRRSLYSHKSACKRYPKTIGLYILNDTDDNNDEYMPYETTLAILILQHIHHPYFYDIAHFSGKTCETFMYSFHNAGIS